MRDNLGSSRPAWPMSTTEGANGLSEMSWRKSSYSGGEGSDCVEVAWSPPPPSMSDGVLVRDSKNPAGPMLVIPATSWRRLLSAP